MDRHSAISDLLINTAAPLTAAEVREKVVVLPGMESLTLAKVRTALEELASWGQVHGFQGYRKSTVYASRAPLDLCAASLLELVRLGRPLPVASLPLRLPRWARPWTEEAVQRLVVRGEAFYATSARGQSMLQERAVRPSDALRAGQLGALTKILAAVNAQRRVPRGVEDLLAWLDAPATTETGGKAVGEPTAELLRGWFAADSGRASSSSMVPVLKTWERYSSWAGEQGLEPSKEVLKKALAALYDDGVAILEPADRPGDLTALERELLVPLAFGPPGASWGIL
jgi:hypothetical protein